MSEAVVKVAVERRWQQQAAPAARHDRRPGARALLAARDAGADEEAALRLDVGGAPDRVGEERVAAVDEDVARLGVRQHRLDELVDRRARLHEEHDPPRRLERRAHLLDRVRADDLRALRLVREELVHLRRRPVVRRHHEAVVVHVEDEVLPHHGEADHRDVRGARGRRGCGSHVLLHLGHRGRRGNLRRSASATAPRRSLPLFLRRRDRRRRGSRPARLEITQPWRGTR